MRTNKQLAKYVLDAQEDESCSRGRTIRISNSRLRGAARTVLGPLLFLCHIKDIPDAVKSSVRLFADESLLYRTIKSAKDHQLLQEDLNSLEAWANDWGMRFNAKKWYLVKLPPLQNRTHTKSPQH